MKETGYTRYERKNRLRRQRTNTWLIVLLTIAMLLLVVLAWRRVTAQNASGQHAGSQLHGMTPAGASVEELMEVRMPEGVANVMKDYTAMTIAFNPQEHVPNYVVWELTRDESAGNAVSRTNNFCPDPDMDGCATLADYRGSGYQRGHMMPAGDAKYDATVMSETFYMTNMCPQAGALNAGAWGRLEEKCRQWAIVDSAIIIVAGPVLSDRITDRIGESGVAVPKLFFKVILSPFANPPRAIGFIMPNAKVPGGMQNAAVSVNEVERITGYDFFSALPDEIEEKIEDECKFQYWSRLK